MDFKTYKIGETYQNNKYVPSIRLGGKWLEELNFGVGEQVIVYHSEDMIVIAKPTDVEQKMLEDRRKEKEIKKLKKQIKSLQN